jgi:hypothetical protein
MNDVPVTAEERYAAIVEAFLGESDVTGPNDTPRTGRGFGATALKVNNKIFAMLTNDGFVVKLPRERVTALVATGKGQHYDPGHGRLMREWLAVAPDRADDWLPLAREAHTFVASRR